MEIINIQMWQFLLFIALIWFCGYLFGFFGGRVYGQNEVLQKYFKKRKPQQAVIADVIKDWTEMSNNEKDDAWYKADEGLKAYYWSSMTDEERRRYSQ